MQLSFLDVEEAQRRRTITNSHVATSRSSCPCLRTCPPYSEPFLFVGDKGCIADILFHPPPPPPFSFWSLLSVPPIAQGLFVCAVSLSHCSRIYCNCQLICLTERQRRKCRFPLCLCCLFFPLLKGFLCAVCSCNCSKIFCFCCLFLPLLKDCSGLCCLFFPLLKFFFFLVCAVCSSDCTKFFCLCCLFLPLLKDFL